MRTIFESPNGGILRDENGFVLYDDSMEFMTDLAVELERLQAAKDKAALYDAGFDDAKRLRAANTKLRAACQAALDDLNPNPAYDPNGIKVKLQAALAETAP